MRIFKNRPTSLFFQAWVHNSEIIFTVFTLNDSLIKFVKLPTCYNTQLMGSIQNVPLPLFYLFVYAGRFGLHICQIPSTVVIRLNPPRPNSKALGYKCHWCIQPSQHRNVYTSLPTGYSIHIIDIMFHRVHSLFLNKKPASDCSNVSLSIKFYKNV